jgi:hypothetical protein
MPLLLALPCLLLSLQHALVSGSVHVSLDSLNVKNTKQAPRNLRLASHSPAADWTVAVVGDESFPPIHVDDGLTFTRTIQKLDASFKLNLEEGHCKSHDKYGDNNCHFEWGDNVLGNYTVVSPQLITAGDTMTGDFRVSLII